MSYESTELRQIVLYKRKLEVNFHSLNWGLILPKLFINYLSRLDAEAIPKLNLENSCFIMGLLRSVKSNFKISNLIVNKTEKTFSPSCGTSLLE